MGLRAIGSFGDKVVLIFFLLYILIRITKGKNYYIMTIFFQFYKSGLNFEQDGKLKILIFLEELFDVGGCALKQNCHEAKNYSK